MSESPIYIASLFLPFLKKIYALIRVITIGSQIKGIISISYKRCEGAIKTFGLKVINPNNLLHNVDITPNPKKATKGLNITRNELSKKYENASAITEKAPPYIKN